MNIYNFLLILNLVFGATFINAQATVDLPTTRLTPKDQLASVIEPYYQALKEENWAVVSAYCKLTADSKPQQFYLDSHRGIEKDSKWYFLRSYPANYTDPGTGKTPDECCLVVSMFTAPGNSHNTPISRLDLWLRTNDNWHIIPEQEICHGTAIQINHVPFEGHSVGNTFESLEAIQKRVRMDQTREAKSDFIMSKAEINITDAKAKLLEATQNKNLTPEQMQAALRKVIEATRAEMLKRNEEYEELQEAESKSQKAR